MVMCNVLIYAKANRFLDECPSFPELEAQTRRRRHLCLHLWFLAPPKKRSTLRPHVFTVHSPSVSNILQGLYNLCDAKSTAAYLPPPQIPRLLSSLYTKNTETV